MGGFADWLKTRRVARIALIGLLFPLLAVLSAGVVVLATNLQGWRTTLQDCAVALPLAMAASAALGVLGGFWFAVGVGAAATWLAAVFLGHLRRVASLTLAVQVTVLLGLVGALAFALWIRDPQAYWEQVLHDIADRARAVGVDVGPADLVPGAAQVMTGVMSASAVISAMAALFLGSWWAGSTGHGDFGQEFQVLRMGRVLGVIAAFVGVLFLTGMRAAVDDLLVVLATGFVVQGLAVVHWHGARRSWPKLWPVALYLPLALESRLAAVEMLLLALLGLFDNGFSLRRIERNVV